MDCEALDKEEEPAGDLLSLLCPEVAISMLGLAVTSSAWDWYQSSIAQHLATSYNITASSIGR